MGEPTCLEHKWQTQKHYRQYEAGEMPSQSNARLIQMAEDPKEFNSIYEYLVDNNTINIEYTTFKDGGIGERFSPVAGRPFNPDMFSSNELEILTSIANRFANTSTQEIIQISHLEKAWIENMESQGVIDYQLSFELNDF